MNWRRDPNYGALRLRLENAHAAIEAATVEASAEKPGGRQVEVEAQERPGHASGKDVPDGECGL